MTKFKNIVAAVITAMTTRKPVEADANAALVANLSAMR